VRSLGREFVKILFQRRTYVGWAGLLAVPLLIVLALDLSNSKPAPGDWSVPTIVLCTYSLGLVLLGLSAATFGKWVERNGPRKTMVASARIAYLARRAADYGFRCARL